MYRLSLTMMSVSTINLLLTDILLPDEEVCIMRTGPDFNPDAFTHIHTIISVTKYKYMSFGSRDNKTDLVYYN